MQISEILEMIFNIIQGPSEVCEDCGQVNSLLKTIRKKEEDISQGILMYNVAKVCKELTGK